MQAYYDTIQSRTCEVRAYRHYTPTETYLWLTTSTEKPEVDKYMVFTVATNVHTEVIHYLVNKICMYQFLFTALSYCI